MDDPIGRTFLVAGLLLAGFTPTIRDGHLLDDMATYTQAAERIINGEAIYASYLGDLTPYKYAPWFAVLWIPLTLIPSPVLGALWLALLSTCAWWLLWRAPWWLAIIAGPFMAWGAAIGNTAPLLFALVALALPTRWAAVAIGAVASLKGFPVLLVVPLVLERRWRDVVVAMAVTLVLIAPMLLFDVSGYQVSAEGPNSINNLLGPVAWLATAAVGVAVVVTRPSWRSAGLAVILTNPRFQWYDLGYLLIGEPRKASRRDEIQPETETAAAQ